jgi:hypothetical protein
MFPSLSGPELKLDAARQFETNVYRELLSLKDHNKNAQEVSAPSLQWDCT